MEIQDNIHIFKTDIAPEKLLLVADIFTAAGAILQWNVDTEDCDNVLRVVSHELSEQDIRQMVCRHGFVCEELQ